MVAPVVAAAIGPLIELAGDWVSKRFKGTKGEKVAEVVAEVAEAVTGRHQPDEAAAILRADPSLLLQYRMALLQQKTDIDRLDFEDRQSARDRDVKMRQAGQKNPRADLLAILAVITLWLLGALLFLGNINSDQKDLLIYLVGIVSGMVIGVYQFEFGSSRGSEVKTQIMAGPKA